MLVSTSLKVLSVFSTVLIAFLISVFKLAKTIIKIISATKPRIGNKIALSIPTDNIIAFIEKIVATYEDNAKKKERLGDYIDRIGFENFKTLVDVEAYL